ncbi:uncharacterized protein [Manis javanica]|uniref:uncharacterized protein n=1 Tax=Manis javanica TaxID=9974 RepID=UPI003C6CFC91
MGHFGAHFSVPDEKPLASPVSGLEPGSFGKAHGKQPLERRLAIPCGCAGTLSPPWPHGGTSGDSRGAVPGKVRVGLPSATIGMQHPLCADPLGKLSVTVKEADTLLGPWPVWSRAVTSGVIRRSQPGSVTGDTLTASSCNGGHEEGPEENLRNPRIGWARRLAWEPEHVPSIINASQLSPTVVGQELHHLVQEEQRGPTVAELEDPRQMQLAPGTRGAPPSCLEPVQELPENPVLELRPVSPASAAAELKDVPAVASAQGPGPELEPHEPSGLGPRALAGMAPGVAEPGPGPEPTNPCAASPWDIPGLVSGPELEPHESSGAGPVAPAGMAQGLEEPEVALEPTTPCSMSTRDLPREEEQTILAFLPRLVAKQLTLMCAELYSRVEHGECKAYVERHPLMEDIVLLAPNILNVLKQCAATFYLVISSCLGGPSTTAQDRARVVEFWIHVAKECLALRNFESFRTIMYALEFPGLRRLERTWGQVSWKSSWIYRKLKKRDKGLKRKQLLEEARAMVRKWPQSPRASQGMKKQGMVPFLGLILYDALEKHQEHHEDATDFLEELLTYKFLARQYDLEPKEHFLFFFHTVELLGEEQSYGLSYHLEPPGQRAGRKGLLQFFRSRKI